MRFSNSILRYLTLFCLSCLLTFSSCSDEDSPDVRSSDKRIISFKFSALPTEAVGTIDESTKTVMVFVPHGTVLTALTPTLEISALATSSPASGVAVDFTNPVTYTITAENESTQNYTVTVTPSFALNNFTGNPAIEQLEYFLLTGNNFGTDASKVRVEFINKTTNAITAITDFVIVTNTSIGLLIPGDLALGEYNVKLIIDSQEKIMTETFTVTVASPNITGVNTLTIIRGENLIISGTRFQESGNAVSLFAGNAGGTYNQNNIISESETSITVKTSTSLPVGSYILEVKSNGKSTSYSELINVIADPNTPIITSLNKTTYTRGETITIVGSNLSKLGFTPNLIFLPFPDGGSAEVRNGISNTEGTQVTYTIPNDFPIGNYTFSIKVDLLVSDTYDDVIQIN